MDVKISETTRRDFLARCTAAGIMTAMSSRLRSDAAESDPAPDWAAMLEDPVRKMFVGPPDLDRILALFPRTQGPPAFDPQQIAENIARLQTIPAVNTGHPSWTCRSRPGLHTSTPRFTGTIPSTAWATYAQEIHDGFPPTIIAAVDALSAWGLHTRGGPVVPLLADDISCATTAAIRYYGPSLSEYGQLLHTAAVLDERAGPAGWWPEGFAGAGSASPSTSCDCEPLRRKTMVCIVRRRPKRTRARTRASTSTTTVGW